jgi:hypothetical protein
MDARPLSHAPFVPQIQAAQDGELRLAGEAAIGTWTLERFVALVLGELKRLNDDENGYGPRGRNFLPHVDIPKSVSESYERLAASPLAGKAVR